MKHFAMGAAFLMFISSLPADATRGQLVDFKPAPQAKKQLARGEPASARKQLVRLEPAPRAPQPAVFMRSYGQTLPPIGYVTFCRENSGECAANTQAVDRLQLTAAKRRELEQVNRHINETVAPVTDLELYGEVERWTYPNAGKGDCEDYVLLKRKLLIEHGWPASTLLITVVRDENNEGHAVLTARTDAGDLVLDNKRDKILAWTDTQYTFIKQQSDQNPLVWISLLPPDEAPQTTVSASNGE